MSKKELIELLIKTPNLIGNKPCDLCTVEKFEKEIRADERAKVVDEAIKILRENALISAMGKIERLKGEN